MLSVSLKHSCCRHISDGLVMSQEYPVHSSPKWIFCGELVERRWHKYYHGRSEAKLEDLYSSIEQCSICHSDLAAMMPLVITMPHVFVVFEKSNKLRRQLQSRFWQ